MDFSGWAGVALTTTTSTGPSDFSMAENIASTSDSLVTSAWNSSAVMPASRSSASVSSARARELEKLTATFAPAMPRHLAVALPRPVEEPVTRATRPAREKQA